jgi:hypothetical protein
LFRFGNGEGAFVDALRHKWQYGGTGNSVQYVAVQRVRDQNAIFSNDMCVLRRAFGDDAAALHPSIVSTARDCLIFHQRSIKQLRGLDIRPAPAQIRHGNDADTAYCHRIVGKRAALCERQNCRRRTLWRKSKIAVGRCAACDLPIDHAFFDRVARDQFAADGEPCFCIRSALDTQFA